MLRQALAILCLLASWAPADAAPDPELYRAEVVVTGTGEPERTRGFREALAEAVVKLTGDARLLGNPELEDTLRDPHRFVEWFEYEDRMKGIPVHDEQGSRDRPHFLRVRFAPARLDAELKRLGSSIWPDRPAIAVWLGVRTATGAYVLGASGPQGHGQRAALLSAARRRGLEVTLPGAGGAGAPVSFGDIARADLRKLASATAPGTAVLSGLLSVADRGYWDIAWRLDYGGRSRVWSETGVTFDRAFLNGLDAAALALSGKAPF